MLVGYGRVGKRIAQQLAAGGIPVVVAEQSRERVEQLRAEGIAAKTPAAATPQGAAAVKEFAVNEVLQEQLRGQALHARTLEEAIQANNLLAQVRQRNDYLERLVQQLGAGVARGNNVMGGGAQPPLIGAFPPIR